METTNGAELPTQIGIDTEKELPTRIRIDTEKELPTRIRIDTENELPTQIGIDTENELPTQIGIDTENELPTRIRIDTEKELPTRIRIDTENELPTQIRIDMENELPTQIGKDTGKELPTQIGIDTEKELPTQIGIDTDKELFKCDVCDKVFKVSSHLQTHRRLHRGKKTHTCNVCDKVFIKKCDILKHRKTCNGTGDEKPFKCEVCGTAFGQESDMKDHFCMPASENPYKCDVCDKNFKMSCLLKRHLRTHTGEKPHQCDVCGKDFTQACQLQIHIRSHTGEKPYNCGFCDKLFSRTGHLKRHLKTHTGEKDFVCDICGKGFSRASDRQDHTRTHTGEKPYKCDVCGKGFTQSAHLHTHLRTHSGEKPFKCEVCNKTFTRASHLRRHGKIHTGAKKFMCSICGRVFCKMSEKQDHLRTHTGDLEKPHQCDVCGKGFAQSGSLRTHRKSHTGDRPFKCGVCGKMFTRANSLRLHTRTHTSDKQHKGDDIMKEKVAQISEEVGFMDYQFPNEWLNRLKSHHEIAHHVLSGESTNAGVEESIIKQGSESGIAATNKDKDEHTDTDQTDLFYQTILVVGPDMNVDEMEEAIKEARQSAINVMSKFELKDVFHFDETRLFYLTLPGRSFVAAASAMLHDYVTITLACNADGSEKLKPLVIGKISNPHCFKDFDVNNYAFYAVDKAASMTSFILLDFLTLFNKEMARQNRHVLLFVDNAPSYVAAPNLSNITVHVLPPKTTGHLLPVDAGIIQAFKSQYRRLQLQHLTDCLEKEQPLSILLSDAVRYIKFAWDTVPASTIERSWRQAGLVPCDNPNQSAELSAVIPGADMHGLISRIQDSLNLAPDMRLTVQEFIGLENDLEQCTNIRDEDLHRLEREGEEKEEERGSGDNDNVIDMVGTSPSKYTARAAIDIVLAYFETKSSSSKQDIDVCQSLKDKIVD